MKRASLLIIGIFLSAFVFAQEEPAAPSEVDSVSVEVAAPAPESENPAPAVDNTEFDAISGAAKDDGEKKSLGGLSEVPAKKRPKTPDSEKIDELNNTDPEANEKNADILKYGLEEDISELLDTMIKNKDVRFANEVYDLFQDTKSVALREKILSYFKTIEDPCLEDYAVMVLNDPYDEKSSTVNACFSYIQMAKTKEASPAVIALLESDNEEYFTGALETLGKIGGANEALYMTEYLERDDLTVAQRQSLVRVLGQLHAVETYDKLVEYAEDKDENAFVRMYSAEAIGVMEKAEAQGVLVELFEDDNPNLRQYVIKGIKHFKNKETNDILIQGLKDSHYKVRQEAITAIKENDVKEADEYLIYRAKNDPVQAVKNDSITTLAKLNTSKGNEYLLSQITEKKVPDGQKSRVAKVLLEEGRGINEIVELAKETVKDDKRKQLRYALGKEMAKYDNSAFSELALEYLKSKDNSTAGTGLDMWARGRYSNCNEEVNALADKADLNAKNKNQLAIKAARLLGRDLDKQTEAKDKEREEAEKAKKAKNASKPKIEPKNEKSVLKKEEKNKDTTPVSGIGDLK